MSVKIDRRAVIALAGLGLAGAVGAVVVGRGAGSADGEYAQLGRGIDNVTLIDDQGATVRWRELNGRPRAVFFGFTNCPVICPVTVWELNDALDRIGPSAQNIDIEFVTIDPARDTPERLKSYFSGFDGRVHGYTGSADTISRVAGSFEVVYSRTESVSGEYSMDHTATVFLLNAEGRVEDVVAYGSPPDVIEARLRTLVGAPSA